MAGKPLRWKITIDPDPSISLAGMELPSTELNSMLLHGGFAVGTIIEKSDGTRYRVEKKYKSPRQQRMVLIEIME